MNSLKHFIQGIGYIIGGIVLLIIVLFGALFFLLEPGCGNVIRETIFSPDQTHKIILYTRDCGATSGFSTHIALANADEDIDDATVIFVADDDHGKANSHPIYPELIDIRARWVRNDLLELSYDKNARLFKEKARADRITIFNHKR